MSVRQNRGEGEVMNKKILATLIAIVLTVAVVYAWQRPIEQIWFGRTVNQYVTAYSFKDGNTGVTCYELVAEGVKRMVGCVRIP